jgi:methylaspartate ammonia-lyase
MAVDSSPMIVHRGRGGTSFDASLDTSIAGLRPGARPRLAAPPSPGALQRFRQPGSSSMRVVDVLFSTGFGGYYYDDQAAIRAGATQDGFLYRGTPLTAGFRQVRQPAESLSVGLCLEDGAVAWGDMMTVQYSGAAGRDPLFSPDAARGIVETQLLERLAGRQIGSFVDDADAVALREDGVRVLPVAVEYGISQALLKAAAHVRRKTMAEVLCEDFGIPLLPRRVPLFAQSGDDRYVAVDKMILKRVDVLPHALINSPAKFGERGSVFLDYVDWLAKRVRSVGGDDYHPTLHVDLYGLMNHVLGNDTGPMVDCLLEAERRAAPYALNIESPADFGGRDAQLEGLQRLRTALRNAGSRIRLIADEWCNTLEDIELFARHGAADLIQVKMPDVGRIQDSVRAVLACKAHGIGAYLGGSCAETEISGAVSAHVAVATQPDMVLAKPAMDVDAAITIVGNEQGRVLATLAARDGSRRALPRAAL